MRKSIILMMLTLGLNMSAHAAIFEEEPQHWNIVVHKNHHCTYYFKWATTVLKKISVELHSVEIYSGCVTGTELATILVTKNQAIKKNMLLRYDTEADPEERFSLGAPF